MDKYKIGKIGAIVLGAFLVANAGLKLTGGQHISELLSGNNLKDWIRIIGIGEALAAILFMLPATHRFGELLLSAYFGGAIVFHMTYPGPYNPETHGFVVPAGILLLVWLISWLRNAK